MSYDISHLGRMPEEMRCYPQWCIAANDKRPLMVDQNGHLYNASVTQGPWMTFDQAWQWAVYYNLGVGFVLTHEDPFICIDLDVKDSESINPKTELCYDPTDWTDPTELARYETIIKSFPTYSELSPSGKGVHIWTYGNIEHGMNRGGVELYGQERFIRCTGWSFGGLTYQRDPNYVVRPVIDQTPPFPLNNHTDLLKLMVEEMKQLGDYRGELVELAPTEEDSVIWVRAVEADNGSKFTDLCNGDWEKFGFPSQSEADLALMSIFTFYSKSNEQCRRMFRQTELGKREKAVKDNRYLDFTLKIIRGRQEREDAFNRAMERQAEEVAETLRNGMLEKQQREQAQQQAQLAANATSPDLIPKEDILPLIAQNSTLPEASGKVDWPPGLAGYIAGFMYNSSIRPVKEVAICSTIGLLCGILGKAFTIPDSGLNAYITLIARSGVGKEALHGSVSKLINKVAETVPNVQNFVFSSDFASGQALTKTCGANPCFVHMISEWGDTLEQIALADGKQGPMTSLRSTMTKLYSKSSPNSTMGGIAYSKKEDSLEAIGSVAYSMIGETTPSKFYNSLTQSMMEDGFMSRFLFFEYNGPRVQKNKNLIHEPDPMLLEAVCGLVTQSITLLSRFQHVEVQFDEASQKALDDYELYCDNKINEADDNESERQMWNRAALKAMRIAALLAAADNCMRPVVTMEHWNWAHNVVMRNIDLLRERFKAGDIGNGDDSRERKLVAALHHYLMEKPAKSYKVPPEMHQKGIVPKLYLARRVCQTAPFRNHVSGSARYALELTIKSLKDNGYLKEVSEKEIYDKYGFTGKAYRIVNLPE